MAAVPDRQELSVTICPCLWDLQGLQAAVYRYRVWDRVELSCAVMPRVVDRQALEVSVVSAALRDASESTLLAPVAEISFL